MQNRKITKGQLHVNLHTKPLAVEKQIDDKGRPAKIRYSENKTRSVINPHSNVVASVRKYRNKEFNKVKRGKRNGRFIKTSGEFFKTICFQADGHTRRD